ncbi:uncharacterized protein LOC110189335 [Drosophila serrata]|uniref:uncharacterized protein LOC110189335 n=1 Tax=Drosophila serrata TaxID=7274 RepID=UPI000A1D2B29|nr:uncharacterized protein LOC110189335 [Drosophila serrata]
MYYLNVAICCAFFLATKVTSHSHSEYQEPPLDVTKAMSEFLQLHQSHYDERLRMCEDTLDNFRKAFGKDIQAVKVQSELMQAKVEETWAWIRPYEKIDSWHRQCVANYSATVPSVSQLRASMNSCGVQVYLDGILSSALTSCNNIKRYATYILNTNKDTCERMHKKSQLGFNNCLKKAVIPLDAEVAKSWNDFQRLIGGAESNARNRIRTSRQCAFNTIYTTSYNIGIARRLILDCIGNEQTCGRSSCSSRCPHQMYMDIKDRDFRSVTIRNPFQGPNRHLGCLELRFK